MHRFKRFLRMGVSALTIAGVFSSAMGLLNDAYGQSGSGNRTIGCSGSTCPPPTPPPPPKPPTPPTPPPPVPTPPPPAPVPTPRTETPCVTPAKPVKQTVAKPSADVNIMFRITFNWGEESTFVNCVQRGGDVVVSPAYDKLIAGVKNEQMYRMVADNLRRMEKTMALLDAPQKIQTASHVAALKGTFNGQNPAIPKPALTTGAIKKSAKKPFDAAAEQKKQLAAADRWLKASAKAGLRSKHDPNCDIEVKQVVKFAGVTTSMRGQ